MDGYQEFAYASKDKIKSNDVGDGQIGVTKLTPGLFQEINKIKTHSHEGSTSEKLKKGAFFVAPTRYVPVSPSISIVSTDPTSTAWNTVNITAQTSSRAIAVACNCRIRELAGAQRGLYFRKTGDTTAQGVTTNLLNTVNQTGSAFGFFIIALSTTQSFDWSVDNADVDNVDISIWGYIEELPV